jgi:hypothetical protein
MYYEKSRPDRRCTRRWNVIWPANIVVGDQEYSCTILDLSECGAKVESSAQLPGFSLVRLASDRFGCLEGQIRWTRGLDAGLRFEAAPAEVMARLKSVVPGMGRRDQAAIVPPPAPEAAPRRRLLDRLLRKKHAA